MPLYDSGDPAPPYDEHVAYHTARCVNGKIIFMVVCMAGHGWVPRRHLDSCQNMPRQFKGGGV